MGDGFEGLDVDKPQVKRQRDRGLPGARRLYASNKGVNDDPIEEIISWTSSEEENEDTRSHQRTTSKFKKVKVSSTEKRASVRSKQSSHPQEEEVTVVSDSDDSNSSVDCHRLKRSEPVGESIEFDIECEDSRSSVLTQPSEPPNDTQVTCTSPCISQATSASTSQSHSPDQGGKVKASQWVKMLDLKTPTKNSQDVTFPELEDSAKKKKKYKRGGLADQLSSLRGRERSHSSMVRHQQSTTPRTPQPDTGSKSLSLRILHLEPLFSLKLARCIHVEGESPAEQLALFLNDQSLQEGDSVQVFAPWQQIRLKHTSELVLLCSNYCIQPPMDRTETETSCRLSDAVSRDCHDIAKVIRGVWKCPCVSGLVYSPDTCPAHLNPGIPGLFSSKTEKDSEEGDDQLSALATIPATQSASVRTRLTKSSILEWVDCHDPSTRLQGRVLRVFCFNTKGSVSEKQYSLLIEDSHGTMCQIFCPEDADTRFPSVLQRGEGLIHVFGGIIVQCRATRDREPALFSVIDRLWSNKCLSNTASIPNTEESTADSEESYSTSQFQRTSAPAFCYVMKEAAGEEGMVIKPTESDCPVVTERITRLTHLSGEDQERVSVCCAVILSLNMSEVKDSLPRSDVRRSHRSVLYLRDPTNPKYVIMTTTEGFCLPELNEMRNKTWMFRDVAYHLGKMTCDRYSCVIPQNTESITSCDLDLSPVTAELSVLDLCSVSGTVCGVDENSAYSWEVCDQCKQENLAQDSSSQQLVCLSCKEVVRKPQTRMKLVVFLSGTSSCNSTPSGHVTHPLPPESKVSVELLQSSIEELLPNTSQTQEGYDMACVLGQKLGPLTCVVLKCKPSEVVLKEVGVDPQK